MIAFPECRHPRRKKCGCTKAGTQRYKCLDCGKKFTESTSRFDGMRIGAEKAAQIISMLCEGMSVRATCRLTDTNMETVLDLLGLIGDRCKAFLERTIKAVAVDDVQVDEAWQFVFCKERTARDLRAKMFVGYTPRIGDSWCFTAVERTTKLVVAWHLGSRDQDDANEFCRKLSVATTGRFHLSTDGHRPYPTAVRSTLAGRVDYGVLIKIFRNATPDDQRQYSPGKIVGTKKELLMGNPDKDRVCTSHTERHNGSMRCFIKRMGRLTYCFSKRWDNHEAAVALYIAHFNFVRKHNSLKGKTPAMASGLADHVWTVAELLEKIGPT